MNQLKNIVMVMVASALTTLAAISLFGFSTPNAPLRHPTFAATDQSAVGLCGWTGDTADPGPIVCTLNSTFNLSAGTGTAPSGAGITVNANGHLRPFVHRVTVTFAAMTAAATTDIPMWTPGAGTRISRMVLQGVTPFSGGALTNVTVTCGTTAGGNQYLLSCDVGTSETPVCGDAAAEIGAGLLSATVADFPDFTGGATDIQCRFTCTGANCNVATAGSAVFYIEGTAYP